MQPQPYRGGDRAHTSDYRIHPLAGRFEFMVREYDPVHLTPSRKFSHCLPAAPLSEVLIPRPTCVQNSAPSAHNCTICSSHLISALSALREAFPHKLGRVPLHLGLSGLKTRSPILDPGWPKFHSAAPSRCCRFTPKPLGEWIKLCIPVGVLLFIRLTALLQSSVILTRTGSSHCSQNISFGL